MNIREVKMSILTGVWEKLIPAFMHDFEGFKQPRMLQKNHSWKEESIDSLNFIVSFKI
jgi:hypothetical protein